MDAVSGEAKNKKLLDLDSLDNEGLKALVLAKQNEIENLNLLVLKLRRMHFGQKSEKLNADIGQLELRLEDLEVNDAAADPLSAQLAIVAVNERAAKKPARRPLPAELPREIETIAPRQEACPDCGGTLRPLGEDVSEVLEYVPARFKVIRTVRPKLSCCCCSRIVQEPAPNRPIDKGLAGPGLLAHVLIAKYADHLPLYRQSEIYAREGIELDRSTMADWVGGASRTLRPLVEALKGYVLSAEKLHGDDVPVPVLEPGNGKTRTGRLWTYVRDDRPAGSDAASAVWFAYSPDRKGEHPARHLKSYRGILQADGYAGFNKLYETGAIIEAACWAHVRRKFFELPGAWLAGSERSSRSYRAVVRNRERDSRAISGGKKRNPTGPITTFARSNACVAEVDQVEALEEIGTRQSDLLCVGTLVRADGIPPRWPSRDGQ
jgi:transposase